MQTVKRGIKQNCYCYYLISEEGILSLQRRRYWIVEREAMELNRIVAHRTWDAGVRISRNVERAVSWGQGGCSGQNRVSSVTRQGSILVDDEAFAFPCEVNL
jgi:hypothetical protein